MVWHKPKNVLNIIPILIFHIIYIFPLKCQSKSEVRVGNKIESCPVWSSSSEQSSARSEGSEGSDPTSRYWQERIVTERGLREDFQCWR